MAGCATRYQGRDGLRPVAAVEAEQDSAQQLLKATVLRADNTQDGAREFVYSPDGKVIQEKITDAAGDLRGAVHYEYTGGLRAERRSYNQSNILVGRRTYSYTAKGLPETEKYYDEKGGLLMVSRFVYDSSGNKIEWTTSDAAGNLVASTRYAYQKGRPQTAILSGPSGEVNMTINFSYDPEGKKIRETYTNMAGNTEKRIVFFYDERGRLVSEETFSPFKTFLGKTVYEYSEDYGKPEKIYRYDDRGNPRETVINEYALKAEESGAAL
jgi:antitoxin component YwqK of YwqJK toxin-antitoxin module